MDKNTSFLTKTIVVWVGALLCCALWGSAFPCIKIGYEMMNIAASDTASQILYAGIRFTIAGVLVIAIACISGKSFVRPKGNAWSKVALLSLFQTILQYLFFYIGLANTTGVKASIIEGMNVFVAVAIAGVVFKLEKVTSRKVIGCIIGFIGVVLVNVSGEGIDTSMSLLGEGFIFFSTVAYAFSSVVMKYYSKTENPVMLSGYQFVFGGLVMMTAGALFGGNVTGFDTASIAMLMYLAFISAGAYTIWSLLLKYNPVSKVAVFGFMNPVIGVILSAIVLDEMSSLGANCIISLALVCLGIYIVNKK